MKTYAYTYAVIRYTHDLGAGEALNIGVVLSSPEAAYAGALLESRYERLSHAFAGFSGDNYRHAVLRLKAELYKMQKTWQRTPLLSRRPDDVSVVISDIWPDSGTSFRLGPVLSGIATDLEAEMHVIFDRMVSSQYAHTDEVPRRDDDYVWRKVFQARLPDSVLQQLRPKKFTTDSVDIEFDHAIKNGAWHVVQPLSMDYKSGESMQRKASQWVGTTVGLHGVRDLARIYFLLGAPRPGHKRAYERAKSLLSQAAVPTEIVEEKDAERLGPELEALLSHHQSGE